jgi:hypothetical protein
MFLVAYMSIVSFKLQANQMLSYDYSLA